MLLPPGDYFVSILPTQYYTNWVQWPQRLHLEDGQHLVLKLDSGVVIPDALAAQPPPYTWTLSSPDKTQVVQNVQGAWGSMLVPPGKYLWAIQRTTWNSMSVTFPQPVTVEAGQMTTLPLPARIDLVPGEWAHTPYCFRVYDQNKTPIASEQGGQTCWLPPGDYRLTIQPTQWYSRELTWIDNLRLDSNADAKIPLDSGIDVEPLDPKYPSPWSLQFIPENQTDPVQSFSSASWGGVLLPPGKYRIAEQPYEWNCQNVPWPTLVEVKPGQLTKLTLDSGIRLDLRPDQTGSIDYQIISTPPTSQPATQPAAGTVVQGGHSGDALLAIWIPPGAYSVQLKQGWSAWVTAAQNVIVAPGAITDVKVTLPQPQTP